MAQAEKNTLMAVHRVIPKFFKMDMIKSNVRNITKNSSISLTPSVDLMEPVVLLIGRAIGVRTIVCCTSDDDESEYDDEPCKFTHMSSFVC